MTRSSLNREEVAQRGRSIYQQRIRSLVETAQNIGKIVSIDVETGEYAIDGKLIGDDDTKSLDCCEIRDHLFT